MSVNVSVSVSVNVSVSVSVNVSVSVSVCVFLTLPCDGRTVWVSVLYVPYALPVLMGLFSTDFTLLQISHFKLCGAAHSHV